MKLGFQSEEALVATSDGHNFRLLEPLIFVRANGQTIIVPTGATTDGASTPRLLWREAPPFGKYWRAAFVHDYLYRESDVPKETCDTIFFEAMRADGVDLALAEALYQGVHLFGRSSFDEDRAARATAHA